MRVLKIYGLVLAGGSSRRMRKEKGLLRYHGVPQVQRCFELLAPFCEKVFLSVRPGQRNFQGFPQIQDSVKGEGPLVGILSAMKAHPRKTWMVLACDLPFMETTILACLVKARNSAKQATTFRSAEDGSPEPLCSIYEPSIVPLLEKEAKVGHRSLRGVLAESKVEWLDAPNPKWLQNVNTQEEYERTMKELRGKKKIQILYFASLREKRGIAEEVVLTETRTPKELYSELKKRNGFGLDPRHLKISINDEFQDWSTPLKNNDRVAFLPPMAGG